MAADLDLGRALVADPRWEWRAGMLARTYTSREPSWWGRVRITDPALFVENYIADREVGRHGWTVPLPDLDDPATAGVIVGMLGRGWLFHQRRHDGVWEVSRPDSADIIEDTSLGRAAARAWLGVTRG